MSEVPKIPVPTVTEINKYPWASQAKFLYGIIAFLMVVMITVFIKFGSPKDCEDREREANLRADKAQQQLVEFMRDYIPNQRYKDSMRYSNKHLADTIQILKQKLNTATELSQKAIQK